MVALERHSSHPISRALLAAFDDRAEVAGWIRMTPRSSSPTLCRRRAAEWRECPPAGTCVVGSPDFLRSQGVRLEPDMERGLAGVISDGHTPVLVAVDDRVVAVVGIGDPLRPDAAEAVTALRRMGHHVQLLSGDHPAVVARVARALSIPESDARGAATPEDKVAYVQQLAELGACRHGR